MIQTITERNAKLAQWLEACQQLEAVKNIEAELRKELSAFVLNSNRTDEFSATLKLANGYGLKATQNINYKLDENSRIEVAVNNLCAIGHAEDAEVFKWSPTLSKSAYKKLCSDSKAIVDEVLTAKIGMPTLEFITPKGTE